MLHGASRDPQKIPLLRASTRAFARQSIYRPVTKLRWNRREPDASDWGAGHPVPGAATRNTFPGVLFHSLLRV